MPASPYTRSGRTSSTWHASPRGGSGALAVSLVAAATLFGSAANAQTPDAPTGLTATGGFRKIDLLWTRAPTHTAVDAYQYRLSTDGGDNWSDWTDVPDSNTLTIGYTVTSLADETAYTVELRIRHGEVRSWAARATATTDPAPRPERPTGLTATGGLRRIELLWTRATHGNVDAYQYRLSTDGGDNWSPDWDGHPPQHPADHRLYRDRPRRDGPRR